MRKLLWTAVALMTAYCGYWFVGSYGVLQGARAALEQVKAGGMGDFADVTLAGFPSRFDVTVDKPMLHSADGQVQWSAPFVQVLALSYQPNKVIVVWPHEQTVTVAGQAMTLRTDDMRASAAVEATTDLPLDHAELVATKGALVSPAGWSVSFDDLRFATRRGAGANVHDLGLAVDKTRTSGIALPASFAGSPADVTADATLTFDRPMDRHATGARVTGLSVRMARLIWGKTVIDAKGEVTIGADGVPEGRLTISAQGWRDVLTLLTQAGVIRAEIAPTVENLLAALEKASPKAGILEIPVTFASGLMSLGPLPLGPAPTLPGYSQ